MDLFTILTSASKTSEKILNTRPGRLHPNPMMSPTRRVDVVSTILMMKSGLEKHDPKNTFYNELIEKTG